MPLSVKEMTSRARMSHDSDSINQLSIEKDIELSQEFNQPRPRKNTRMGELLQQIYDVFQGFFGANGNLLPQVGAREFDFLVDPEAWPAGRCYSPPSVIKAKRLLGINSVRISSEWYWTYPRRAPTEIQQQEYEKQINNFVKDNNEFKHKLRASRTPSAKELINILSEHNYDALATVVVEALPYNRQTIIRSKAKLGIVSLKRKAGWHWIYPAPEVQEWLLEQLADGPKLVSEIIKEASERGWSEDVVHMSKKAAGGISFSPSKQGRAVWRLT